MSFAKQIAKHLREVHFGGNWTTSNLKDALAGVTWQQATTKIGSFNTIAALVYHVNYYVGAVLQVLEGRPLTASDKYCYDVPPINSREDWERLLNKVWTEAESFAKLIEQMPDEKLLEGFIDPKYGNYYRNLQGIIEHMHYHLGQIVILKKLLTGQNHLLVDGET